MKRLIFSCWEQSWLIDTYFWKWVEQSCCNEWSLAVAASPALLRTCCMHLDEFLRISSVTWSLRLLTPGIEKENIWKQSNQQRIDWHDKHSPHSRHGTWPPPGPTLWSGAPSSKVIKDLWAQTSPPPHPVSESLAQHTPWYPMVNMQHQVTLAHGAKLQIICLQSLVSAIGKHPDKVIIPPIPILSFSQAGRFYPGGRPVPSDRSTFRVVAEKSGKEELERSKDCMFIRTAQGRREKSARLGTLQQAMLWHQQNLASWPSPREFPVQQRYPCHRAEERSQPYLVSPSSHASSRGLHTALRGTPTLEEMLGRKKWHIVFRFTSYMLQHCIFFFK